jgi:hypothetical protein
MTEQNKVDELTIQDLAMARAIIEIATERSVFKANELAGVGNLYNKLDAFLKQVEAQAKAAQEGAAAAQAPADAPVENEDKENA